MMRGRRNDKMGWCFPLGLKFWAVAALVSLGVAVAAGVSYTVGRESNATCGETISGIARIPSDEGHVTGC